MSRRTKAIATPILALFVAAAVYGVGATRTAQAREAKQTRPPKICWHDQTSVYRCGDAPTFIRAVSSADIQEISVTVRPKSGLAFTIYVPGTTDAIFFSAPAIESMLLRHYDATNKVRGDSLRALLGLARVGRNSVPRSGP